MEVEDMTMTDDEWAVALYTFALYCFIVLIVNSILVRNDLHSKLAQCHNAKWQWVSRESEMQSIGMA